MLLNKAFLSEQITLYRIYQFFKQFSVVELAQRPEPSHNKFVNLPFLCFRRLSVFYW